jgi:hypothetical protein
VIACRLFTSMLQCVDHARPQIVHMPLCALVPANHDIVIDKANPRSHLAQPAFVSQPMSSTVTSQRP